MDDSLGESEKDPNINYCPTCQFQNDSEESNNTNQSNTNHQKDIEERQPNSRCDAKVLSMPINDAGPLGRRKIYQCSALVDTWIIGIPRRARLNKVRSELYLEMTYNPKIKQSTTVPMERMVADTCKAIQAASLLADELGSEAVATDDVIPMSQQTKNQIKRRIENDIKRGYIANYPAMCFKNTVKSRLGSTVGSDGTSSNEDEYAKRLRDFPVKEPLLWHTTKDRVIHFDTPTWKYRDAIERQEDEEASQIIEPKSYTLNAAAQRLLPISNKWWHFHHEVEPQTKYVPEVLLATPEHNEIGRDNNSDEKPIIGLLIEYCCDKDSALCHEKYAETELGRIILIRLTVEHDLTTKQGLEYAKSIVDRYKHLPAWLWCSIPCTGGSTLQKQNEHLPSHAARMREHNQLFKALHRNFMNLARYMRQNCSWLRIAYEWPRFNTWWQRQEVIDMQNELDLLQVDFDGCTVGVKSERDHPMLKPWRFATSSPELRETFQKCRCNREFRASLPQEERRKHYKHDPILGGTRAKDSAYYPDKMVMKIQNTMQNDFEKIYNNYTKQGKTIGDNMMAIVDEDGKVVSLFDIDEYFMIDSGCARAFASVWKIDKFPDQIKLAVRSARITTGAGLTKCSEMLNTTTNLTDNFTLQMPVYKLEAPTAPSVMSMGMLVKDCECHFIWLHGYRPCLILPEGLIIPLVVQRNIPYISVRCIQEAQRDQTRIDALCGIHVVDGHLEFANVAIGYEASAAMTDAEMDDRRPNSSGASSSGINDPPRTKTRPGTSGNQSDENNTTAVNTDNETVHDDDDVPSSDEELHDENREEDQAIEPPPRAHPALEPRRPTVRRNLKEEANSAAHYLLHRPGLPQHCEECAAAKTKRRKRFCGAFSKNRTVTKHGDIITCDHTPMLDCYHNPGLDGNRELFVMLDAFTKYRNADPVKNKDEEESRDAMVHWKGSDEWKLVYSDNALAIRNAARHVGVAWEPCLPGVHHNNALIENTIQQIQYDIKVINMLAGLPACYWPYSAPYCAHIHNITRDDEQSEGSSPWYRKYDEHFQGKLFPFGCGVFFLPAASRYVNSKAGPNMSYGIFLGYRLAPGGRWTGQYVVADIEDFIGKSMARDAKGTDHYIRPHHTDQVVLGRRGICFPLKNKYDRANMTIEAQDAMYNEINQLEYDEYGHPDLFRLTKHDAAAPEKTPAIELIERELEAQKLIDYIDGEAEILTEAETEIESGAEDEDDSGGEYEPPLKVSIHESVDYRGVTRKYQVNEHGERIQKRSKDKVPWLSQAEWRRLTPEFQEAALEEFQKKNRKRKVRGVKKAWLRMTNEQKDQVKEYFKKMEEEKLKLVAKDEPAAGITQWDDDDYDKHGELIAAFEQGIEDASRGFQDRGGPMAAYLEHSKYPINKYKAQKGMRGRIPRMPTIPRTETTMAHRKKQQPFTLGLPCMIARPISKAEIAQDVGQRCSAAQFKEWSKLWEKQVFDISSVHEWREVAAKARKEGRTIHMGRAFGLMVEKNYELPEDDERRKMKYRVVFQGNQVHTQNWEAAVFQGVGSAPASMDAGKCVDIIGSLPGNDLQQSDAEQAYLQSDFTGTETWVAIPEEGWPEDWWMINPDGTKTPKYDRPVVRMLKALYGHPDSGTIWEEHCNKELMKVGFKPIDGWSSCFYHERLNCMLAVYVDDFKMGGPVKNLPKAWKLITDVIMMEKPTAAHLYLGCIHEKSEITVEGVGKVNVMKYNMESYLTQIVEDYEELITELTGRPAEMKHVSTPFKEEDGSLALQRAPLHSGTPALDCPHCRHSFSPNTDKQTREKLFEWLQENQLADDTSDMVDCDHQQSIPDDRMDDAEPMLAIRPSKKYKAPHNPGPQGGVKKKWINQKSSNKPKPGSITMPVRKTTKQKGFKKAKNVEVDENSGLLHPYATSLLMRILYAAREARYDLLRAVNRLACTVAFWDFDADAKLHQLICYIKSSLDHRLIGWIGNTRDELQPHSYSDADFAGCPRTQKSTTGIQQNIEGSKSCFSTGASSKRQPCLADSTPAAELTALHQCVKQMMIPALDVWELVLPRVNGIVHEDNQTAITTTTTGRNQTMRYLLRAGGISIAFLHQMLGGNNKLLPMTLEYTDSKLMVADIHTKGFTDANAWRHARLLANVCAPDEIHARIQDHAKYFGFVGKIDKQQDAEVDTLTNAMANLSL